MTHNANEIPQLLNIDNPELDSGLGNGFTSDLTGYLIIANGEWDGLRCPDCGAETLNNTVGERWCSMVGCEFVSTVEIKFQYVFFCVVKTYRLHL